MREDYAIAADLCEEHGLVAPTLVLRQIAEGAGEVFYVLNDEMPERPDELPGTSGEIARPKRLFVAQEAAERHSTRVRANFLRKNPYHSGTHDYLFIVPEVEFRRRVGAILGMGYHLAEQAPVVPTSATDEQATAIAELLRPGYFGVICVPIRPGGPGG